MPDVLPIEECFVSLQGEGILSGTPSSFVRVSGCNLRCSWCDTPNTSWSPKGHAKTVDALLDFCATGPHHVVLTGGEPMIFPRVSALCGRLRAAGHHVTIETAGTRTLPGLRCDLISISPKLAHSAPDHAQWNARHEQRRMRPHRIAQLIREQPWQLKFVVRDGEAELGRDIDEIEELLITVGIPTDQRDRVLLMPEGTDPDALRTSLKRIAPTALARGFRLSPRLHIDLYGHGPGR